MTAEPQGMIEEYIAECVRREKLLNIREIDESEDLSFGEGPVYTHFGGIERFRFRAFVEALVWTERDQDGFFDDQDLHREDVLRLRR